MGEIKSTLELMMERTKGMGLSEEEKKRLKHEGLEKKAKGYKVKVLSAPETAEFQLQGLEGEPEEDREALQRLIWNSFVDELPVDSSVSDYLEVMEKLPHAKKFESELAGLNEEIKTGAKSQKADKKKILNKERKRLASFGISGEAVIPVMPEASDKFTRLAEVMEDYKKKLKISD